MSFPKKLKILRVIHGLTQRQMSEKLYLSLPVYCRLENGHKSRIFCERLLDRLMEEFRVSPAWLFDGNPVELNENIQVPHTINQSLAPPDLPLEWAELVERQQELVQKIIGIAK